MSTSMHEVFNWNGRNTAAAPRKLTLSVAGSQIDFEGPPRERVQSARNNAARNRHSMVMVDNYKGENRKTVLNLCFLHVYLQFLCTVD